MSEVAWPEPGSRPPEELLAGLYADDEGLERRLAPLLEAHRDALEAAARLHFGLTPLSAGWTDEQAQRFREQFAAVASQPLMVLPPACSPDHHTQCGTIEIGDNQDRDCLSLYQGENGEWDTVHICDWPALKAAVDQHQRERGGRT